MKMPRTWVLSLLLVVFSSLLAPRSGTAVEHIFDFDDLSEGVTFDDRGQPYAHRGLAIRGTGHYGGSVPTVFSPSTGTVSGPHALRNELAYGSEFGSDWQDVEVTLTDYTADQIGCYVGLSEFVGEAISAQLIAYRAVEATHGSGYEEVARDSLTFGPDPVAPGPPHRLSVERPEGDIAFFRIQYWASGGREVIDSIFINEYEGVAPPPPEDTTDPRVHITNPPYDAEFAATVIVVAGYVDENVGLFEVTASSSLETVTFSSAGYPPRFFFGGPIRIEGTHGPHTIEVTATDLAGSTDTASVRVHYDPTDVIEPPTPPAPTLDIVGSGMEVTQAIQGWGMIGGTPAGIDNVVQLIRGKTTLVRVYAEAFGTPVDVPGVSCRLGAFHTDGGLVELPDSPIYADERVTLQPGEDYIQQRPDADKSFNFVLPPSWTEVGTLRLWATVNPFDGVPEATGAFDVLNDVVLEVIFHDTTDELCVEVYPIRSTNHGNVVPTGTEIDDNLDLLQHMYPVPPSRLSVNVRRTIDSDIVMSTDADLSNLMDDFLEELGFELDHFIDDDDLPCRHTVFLGLTHDTVLHRGVTAGEGPVSLSAASSDFFYRMKSGHETGHSMGLGHVQGCNAPAAPHEPYPAYTDPSGVIQPDFSIGDWGVFIHDDGTFDLFDPATIGDMMSYCGGSRWMSVYTWNWLCDHFGTHVVAPLMAPLLAREQIEPPIFAKQGGEEDDYLVVTGSIKPGGLATLKPAWSVLRPIGGADEPGKGNYSLSFLDRDDNVLFERKFEPRPIQDLEEYSHFREIVPAQAKAVTIVLSGRDLAAAQATRAGPAVPQVTVTTPEGGERWPATGRQSIGWNARDPDPEDRLTYAVEYSHDLGKTWMVIASGLREPGMATTLDHLPGAAKTCLIRVRATDGIHQASDVCDLPFTKDPLPPAVSIFRPSPTAVVSPGQVVVLQGGASDLEDGALGGESLTWSSSLDGPLGTGPVLGAQHLRPGLHVLRLEAVDSDGLRGSDTSAIYITDSTAEGGAVRLPKTGQTTCWDSAGRLIPCGDTGQDGEIRAGVDWPAPRFRVNPDETITDALSGLVWARDGRVPGLPNRCEAGAKTWGDALAYVDCLNRWSYLGHRDWRLPNVGEMLSLVTEEDVKVDVASWLREQGFLNTEPTVYWTSTTTASDISTAWAVGLVDGSNRPSSKKESHLLLPVRSTRSPQSEEAAPAGVPRTGQLTSYATGDDGDVRAGLAWPAPRFTDHGNGTITDDLTGLVWLEDFRCLGATSWEKAFRLIEELNALRSGTPPCRSYRAHYRDWRLPNRHELQSLIDFSRSAPALPPGHPFAGLGQQEFWSSTSFAPSEDGAWIVRVATGMGLAGDKVAERYAWPVRGGVPSKLGEADVAISIRDSADPVLADSPFRWIIDVNNQGLEIASGVTVRSTFPPWIPVTSMTPDQGSCTFMTGEVTCELGNLARGETVTVTIELRAPTIPDTLTNTATVTSEANDPDASDNVAIEETTVVFELPSGHFVRGDVNADAGVDVSDAVYVLGYLFGGSPKMLPCEKAGDADDSGEVDISDPIYLLTHLFVDGPAPPEPASDCGLDRTPDALSCAGFPPCE